MACKTREEQVRPIRIRGKRGWTQGRPIRIVQRRRPRRGQRGRTVTMVVRVNIGHGCGGNGQNFRLPSFGYFWKSPTPITGNVVRIHVQFGLFYPPFFSPASWTLFVYIRIRHLSFQGKVGGVDEVSEVFEYG